MRILYGVRSTEYRVRSIEGRVSRNEDGRQSLRSRLFARSSVLVPRYAVRCTRYSVLGTPYSVLIPLDTVEVIDGRTQDRRPGHLAGDSGRASPAATRPGNDRLGELRQRRGHGGAGERSDQQVRRGLPRQTLLRRL